MADKKDEADRRGGHGSQRGSVPFKGGRGSLRNVQKSQLEKLMANPDKQIHIPEMAEGWKPKEAPEFVRFYMGSSAGAGSEVFHVYRHLRRRENIRQQYIQESAEKEDLEKEFQEKLIKNYVEAEERTSKKRAKRLKKKQRKVEKKSNTDKEEEVGEEGDKRESGSCDNEPAAAESAGSGDDTAEEPHFVIGGR